MGRTLRLGTRASALARWQAEWVAARIREEARVPVELVFLTTQGDRQQVGPLVAFGGQGAFTKELQRALLANEIDLAVHSLKDLPTDVVEGLRLGAVPERAPTADVLVFRTPGLTLATLPTAALVGTGSPRRRSQLWRKRPDLRTEESRGNVDTRLKKLESGQFDALVLAEAGLTRLGLASHIGERLAPPDFYPAVGQGALGIEIRSADAETAEAVRTIDHPPTHLAVRAERAMLARLRAGCLAPVGGLATWSTPHELHLAGASLSPNGSQRWFAEGRSAGLSPGRGDVSSQFHAAEAAELLGRSVAESLLAAGADKSLRRHG